MNNKKIVCIVGARPQFIKHAPLELALKTFFNVVTIHTGQHYDAKMSKIFFDQLNISPPTYMLKSSGKGVSHGQQTGEMLTLVEEILMKEMPMAVLVYGDTNSTLAGALAASKLNIPVIHIEAGLRSFNKKMPEEINRILTDHVSSILFAPSTLAVENLKKEGLSDGVVLCGDVMNDMVLLAKEKIPNTVDLSDFYLITIHRPYNTDEKSRLFYILDTINKLDSLAIFPIHPRTLTKIADFGGKIEDYQNIKFIEPLSYFELIEHQIKAKAIITDSGGVQKEAYILRKKCITIRSETEWAETLQGGWNHLVFDNLDNIQELIYENPTDYIENLYGNGQASNFISQKLNDFFK
jgi:UDP-GlcNAc3NAcA epimerase